MHSGLQGIGRSARQRCNQLQGIGRSARLGFGGLQEKPRSARRGLGGLQGFPRSARRGFVGLQGIGRSARQGCGQLQRNGRSARRGRVLPQGIGRGARLAAGKRRKRARPLALGPFRTLPHHPCIRNISCKDRGEMCDGLQRNGGNGRKTACCAGRKTLVSGISLHEFSYVQQMRGTARKRPCGPGGRTC